MILRSEKLVKKYKHRTVVNEVSVEVKQGEIVGLLGPNGAGKTTSFYVLVGLIKPMSGKVFLDDTDITAFPMYKRAQLGIGYLPQEASVFRKMSVSDNILAVLELRADLDEQGRDQALTDLLDELQIGHVANQMGASLSGGERRRVEIARALAANPRMILLDEPFAGVDPISVLDIQTIIKQLKQRGIGVLITDHNVRETLGICDRAYILFEGSALAEGKPDFLLQHPDVRRVYLGEQFKL